MSKALITEAYLTDIADAIRAKNGSSDTYTPPQMAAAIGAIPTGGDVTVEELSVSANGTYTAPTGKAYSPVTVDVSGGGYTGTFIYAINLSQGGAWIDTGISVASYTTLDCVNKTSGNYTQIMPVAVSSIPTKTGSQDVFLTVFKNGGKDFNLRIENGTLRMSFNGTGSNVYETLVFGDGNLSSLLQGVTA